MMLPMKVKVKIDKDRYYYTKIDEIFDPILRKKYPNVYSNNLMEFISEFFAVLDRNLKIEEKQYYDIYGSYVSGADYINLAIQEIYALDNDLYSRLSKKTLLESYYNILWDVVNEVFYTAKNDDETIDLFHDAYQVYLKGKASNFGMPLLVVIEDNMIIRKNY